MLCIRLPPGNHVRRLIPDDPSHKPSIPRRHCQLIHSYNLPDMSDQPRPPNSMHIFSGSNVEPSVHLVILAPS